MKRKALVATVVILATILCLIGIKHHLDVKTEYAAEMADLQGMRNAELDVRMLWKDKMPGQVMEYWYDADNFSLIPITETQPDSHGCGTKVRGGAVVDFNSSTGISMEYSENSDYRSKVIHVIIRPNGEIKVDWAEARE